MKKGNPVINRLTSPYLFRVLLLVGVFCGVSLPEGIAQPKFSIQNATVDPDASFCLDVTVENFVEVLSFQFSISWDQTVLELEDVKDFGLLGFSKDDLDSTLLAEGKLGVDWFTGQCGDPSGFTLTDSSLLFRLCFRAIGEVGDRSSVQLGSDPEPISVNQVGFCPLSVGLDSQSGTVSIGVIPVELEFVAYNSNDPDLLCMNVRVDEFTNLSDLQFSLDYDGLTTTVESISPNTFLDNSGSATIQNPSAGKISFQWSSTNGQEVSVTNGTLLFQICFRLQEPCGTVDPLVLSDLPVPAQASNPFQPGTPISVAEGRNTGFLSSGDIPSADAGRDITIDCFKGDTLDLGNNLQSETIQYRWRLLDGMGTIVNGTEGSPVVQVTGPGLYELEAVSLTSTCTAKDSILVTERPTTILANAGQDITIGCNSEYILDGSGSIGANPIAYDWFDEQGNLIAGTDTTTVFDPGSYVLLITDLFTGCTDEDTILLRPNETFPRVDAGGPELSITCVDTVLTLGADTEQNDTYTYQWQALEGGVIEGTAAERIIQVSAPGRYRISVTDNFTNCAASDEVTVIRDNTLPPVQVEIPDLITCTRDEVALEITPTDDTSTFQVSWRMEDGIALQVDSLGRTLVREPGLYLATVTLERTGCSSQAAVSVFSDFDEPSIELGPDIPLPCVPDSGLVIDVRAQTNGLALVWSGPSLEGLSDDQKTIRIFDPGLYRLEVTDLQNGCTSNDSLNINLNGELPLAQAGEDQVICEGTTDLFAEGLFDGASGRWEGPEGIEISTPELSSTAILDVPSGIHTFHWILSSAGCTDYSSDSVLVVRQGPPEATNDRFTFLSTQTLVSVPVLFNDSLIGEGWDVLLQNGVPVGEAIVTSGGVVDWRIPRGTSGLIQLTYTVCSQECPDLCDQATLTLQLPEDPNAEEILPPNAITPNGDGVNDFLVFDEIAQAPEAYPEAELTVFNRWGQILYRERPYQNDWGGTQSGGKDLPEGTYYFILRLSLAEGEVYKGDITILR